MPGSVATQFGDQAADRAQMENRPEAIADIVRLLWLMHKGRPKSSRVGREAAELDRAREARMTLGGSRAPQNNGIAC